MSIVNYGVFITVNDLWFKTVANQRPFKIKFWYFLGGKHFAPHLLLKEANTTCSSNNSFAASIYAQKNEIDPAIKIC